MKIKNQIYIIIPLLAVFLPFFALAQDMSDIIETIEDLAGEASIALGAVAIAFFVYGVVKYVSAAGNAEQEKTARRYLLAGVIGLFVLIAFWSLVYVLTETFELGEESAPLSPDIESPF